MYRSGDRRSLLGLCWKISSSYPGRTDWSGVLRPSAALREMNSFLIRRASLGAPAGPLPNDPSHAILSERGVAVPLACFAMAFSHLLSN